MKRVTTILFSLVAVASVFAQTPKSEKTEAPALPTIDQVVENHVKAIGGKEAFMKLTSRVQKGTFDLPAFGVSGAAAERFAKAPNKVGLTIDVPGFGLVQSGFNGTVAWEQRPDMGLREKAGAELAQAQFEGDFYGDVNPKGRYSKMEITGKENVGAREAYVVVAKRADGESDKLYFDAQTWLLVRNDSPRDSPEGKFTLQIYPENYKDVDGVKVAHTLRQVTPIGELTFTFTETKHNVSIDDAKFNKPAPPK